MAQKADQRHEDISRDQHALAVRAQMNAKVSDRDHQPVDEYMPSAFRHFSRRNALIAALEDLDFESALDVGSSQGFFGAEIGKRFGTEVWSVDLSDLSARAVHDRYGTPSASADATRLPFKDGCFDLVYSTEVIEHVLDPEVMLAEMRRVARRWVVITTPISQSPDEHEADYELLDEGHINNFDPASMRALAGPEARLGSFRCNATFAPIAIGGRNLPSPFRDWLYRLDQWASQRLGNPQRRFKPLRNRDWLVVVPVEGGDQVNEPAWACPYCRGDLTEREDALVCEREGRRFAFLAAGVPDLFATGREARG